MKMHQKVGMNRLFRQVAVISDATPRGRVIIQEEPRVIKMLGRRKRLQFKHGRTRV